MATETALVRPPVAPPKRPRTVLVGTAFGTAGVVMFFGTLLAIYVSLRQTALADEDGSWIPAGTISLVPGTMMMFTMVMSAFTAAWAVQAIRADDRVHAYLALGLTALLGLAMVNQTAFLYSDMSLPIDESVAATLLYVVTGSHLVAVLVGVILFGLVGLRVFAGQYGSRESDGVAAVAMFWYAVVAVYFVIWYVVYVTK